MFDLVPLAGTRWQVTDSDLQTDFIGQFLEFDFPQPQARTIAAAAIGRDQQLRALRDRAAGPSDATSAECSRRQRSAVS